MAALSVGMVAAEASGDLLAASVLRGLGDGGPVEARGIGGPAMSATGFDAWWHIDALSVRGYLEVLRAYPRLLRMRNSLRDRLIAWRPQLFLGVDAPDFNLGLETALRAQGLRTVQFVGPQIWAWRRERIDKIRAAVMHTLLVFPFEQEIYDQAGLPATYVGHPLADVIDPQPDPTPARQALELPVSATVVALLPGSRPAEIQYLAEPFLRTAVWLAERRPEIHFLLPAAGARLYERLRDLIAGGRWPKVRLTLLSGRSHEALAACDAALVASGTATLETALIGRPMVIAYRMPWLSYRIMLGKAYLPWIGLPNILCRDAVVPEFIQDRATPQAMGQALLRQLDDAAERERIGARFAELHGQLRRGCAGRAATMLRELADG